MAFFCDLPFFVGADYQDSYFGIWRRDILVQLRLGVLGCIYFQAEKSQAVADHLPERHGVFSHAGSEDDRIDAAEDREHTTDFTQQTMRVNVERQFRSGISGDHRFRNVPHVFRDPRHA